MKPEELMIGDWVFNTHHEKNAQITPYDFFTHGHYPDGTQYITISHSVVSGQDFEPIPITPEILEKNGFTTDDDDIYRWTNAREDIVRLYTDDNYTWFIDLCSDICGHIDYLEINSVHELQHALRLCKIDKEIVL